MATETYAIVESGGKQYRAVKGEVLTVDRVPEDEGAKLTLRAVMYRDGSNIVIEPAETGKVKVEAKVTGHLRGEKIQVSTYKPKQGVRKRSGHRSELSTLEITNVSLLSRKPAAKKDDAAKQEKKPAAKKETAAKKAPAKKPAAKKTAAKKPAASKKPAAKSSAKNTSAKKPAAKKPAAKKDS